MSEMTELAERLKDACHGHPHAKIPWPHRILHEAAAAIERLDHECQASMVTIASERARAEAAEAKVERQATEIQRMARKIKNQRKMASTTWRIVEDRAQWTRGVLKRNRFLALCVDTRLAAEAREKRLREALEWYAEQARLCRLNHSEGDKGRFALSNDGGKRARAALESKDE